ncbi:MAG: phage portal protein [Christensenella sp.]|nr:phage portal protein [Christensenella sp.]
MTFRDAVSSVFGKVKNRSTSAWREIGGFTASFSAFGSDVYANEIARSCIRTLSDHRSKANVKVLRNKMPGDLKLQKMIENRPNIYMNGKDYLYKISSTLERYNTAFIFINRDDAGTCVGLYPIPNCGSEAVDYEGKLFIKFYLPNGTQLVASWEDLIVLRKDFCGSDIYGDDNSAILTSMELLTTTSEGMANAIKSTANLRGIIKTTKAMLSPEDKKKLQESFVTDYLALENSSGIAVLDAQQDFTPVSMQPLIANYKNVEELRNNIYRYWGMSEKIVTCAASADEREAFYERHVETFLLALSLEHTNKVFTDRQRGLATQIIFESNRMSYMSMQEKLALVAMVDRGALTPNEWRQALNLAPIEGGDAPLRRLDTTTVPEADGTKKEDNGNADKDGQGVPSNEPAAAGDGQAAR